MKKAVLYEKLNNNHVKCLACNHYCRIMPNKHGICGVRLNKSGDLYLLVYGKVSAANVDPIEKKPLFHFLPGSEIFSIGTIGCDFACDFCQNWDLSQVSKGNGVIDYGKELPPEKIVEYCLKNNIPSIAYTYNEPAIFFEYAYDTAKLAFENGIKNVFVTNGYESKEALEKINPFLNAMNIDLKSFSDKFYRKICKARLKPVLDTIKRAHQYKIWLEITTLIVPGENDSSEELKSIAEFISGLDPNIPWHVTAFHPEYKMNDKPSTPSAILKKAHDLGKKAGLKYVYTGNVSDSTYQNTFCPECGKALIKRNWNSVLENNLNKGRCLECHAIIDGIWS